MFVKIRVQLPVLKRLSPALQTGTANGFHLVLQTMNVTKYFPDIVKDRTEIIAVFGEAQLVRTLELGYELHGGSREDRLAAREWISMFLHEAVVREVLELNGMAARAKAISVRRDSARADSAR